MDYLSFISGIVAGLVIGGAGFIAGRWSSYSSEQKLEVKEKLRLAPKSVTRIYSPSKKFRQEQFDKDVEYQEEPPL